MVDCNGTVRVRAALPTNAHQGASRRRQRKAAPQRERFAIDLIAIFPLALRRPLFWAVSKGRRVGLAGKAGQSRSAP